MLWAAQATLCLLSDVISLRCQVLCLYRVAFQCAASNLLWSKNQTSRIVRAAYRVLTKKPREESGTGLLK